MAQQQTWMEWMFGIPGTTQSTTEQADATNGRVKYEEKTKANDSTSNAQTSSSYGPYIRTGRGGAGNYNWQASAQSEPGQHDVEANNKPSLIEEAEMTAEIERRQIETALQDKQEHQGHETQYVRVGRGYVDRKDLHNTLQSSIPSFKTTPQPSRSAYRGRGGAGNYAAVAAENELSQAEQQERNRRHADELTERVTKETDSNILPPQDVLLKQPKGHEFP